MKAPPRLLDDPNAPPELRKDLARSASSDPGYDVAAGMAAFSAAIASSAASAASTAAVAHASSAGQTGAALKASGLLGSLSLKAGLAAVGTVAVVAVGIASLPARPTPKPAPSPSMHAHASAAKPTRVTDAAPPRAAEAASDASTNQAVALAPTRKDIEPPRSAGTMPINEARAVNAAPSLRPVVGSSVGGIVPALRGGSMSFNINASSRREIAQLGRIKQLLESQPATALRLAEAGDREFAHGILREERQGLAVLALWALGNEHEARARSLTFLNRYPKSPLRPQLAARLAQTAE